MFSFEFIVDSLKTRGGAAIEAPTGSGKTLTGLVAAITYARDSGKKILYLTRTNSQQEQVIKELRILAPESGLKAVPIQGRHNLCPLYQEIEQGDSFSSDSLSSITATPVSLSLLMSLPMACLIFITTGNVTAYSHPFPYTD